MHAGVVFPAIQTGVDRAIASYEERGLDVSAFTDIASAEGGTYLLPMTENGTEIRDILQPVLARTRFDYRQGLAGNAARAYFGERFPRHLVIDPTGRVIFDEGAGSELEPPGLREAIRAALGSTPGARPAG